MKKILLMAGIAISSLSYAQDAYFSGSIGYGLGFPGNSSAETQSDTSGLHFNTKNIGLGGGMNVNVSYGLPLDDNMLIDLGFSFQRNFGQSVESSDQSVDFDPNTFDPIFITTTTMEKYQSWSLKFAPTLRIESDARDIRPYLEVGPQIQLAGMTYSSEIGIQDNSVEMETKYSPSLSVGGTAALGIDFEISRDLMFFAAVRVNAGYYSPKKSEVTVYNVDGVNMLNDLPTAAKETEYVKEGDIDSFDADEPSISPRSRLDYSSIGLNAGIRIIL